MGTSKLPKIDRDRIELDGLVTDALPNTTFKVKVTIDGGEGFYEVLASLAGKLRSNRIRILPGDHVKIEVSPYDLKRGRIIWRK
jgi:translation initiation factor IF-1